MWKEGVSNEEYHNGPELSSHRLIDAARLTGTKYKMKYESEQERQYVFDFGSIYHMAVLEPLKFEMMSNIAILPDEKRPTSSQLNAKKPADKTVELIRFWEDWDLQNSNKYHITRVDYEKVFDMVHVLKNHPLASKLMFGEGGRNELSGYFDYNGEKCRIRADRLLDDGTIIDLKSATDASYHNFFRNGCANGYGYGYQTQAAFYCDGADIIDDGPKDLRDFIWVVQEKVAPFDIAIYSCGEKLMQEGRFEYGLGVMNHKRYKETEIYTSYPEEVQELEREITC